MPAATTPEMASEIKKYKKPLEKEQIFTYAYKQGEHFFRYVVLQRFKKTTGILIFSAGGPVSRREQIRACRAFYHFNRVLGEADLQLILDLARPFDLLQNVR